jgi:hypothetical protein
VGGVGYLEVLFQNSLKTHQLFKTMLKLTQIPFSNSPHISMYKQKRFREGRKSPIDWRDHGAWKWTDKQKENIADWASTNPAIGLNRGVLELHGG